MNTRNYHAHIRIRICIENNQRGSGCVHVQQTAMRYHKIGLVDKHRLIIYISWNIAKQSRMTNKSINQLVMNLHMWGPHQSPFYLAWINSDNSIVWNYGTWFLACFKTFSNRGSMKIACQKWKWQQNFIKNAIFRIWNPKDENLKCETPGEGNGGGAGFRVRDIRRRWNVSRYRFSGHETSGWK